MINNNSYSIPDKKPLSQSKILTESGHIRHPSAHIPSRPSNDMYNSSIFMKSSSIINHQSEPFFFQPIREPLSPHSKYPTQQTNIQYIPQFNNVLSMRQPQNNYFPPPISKDTNIERALNDLREKYDSLEKRLQIQDRKHANVNDVQSKKVQSLLNEGDSLNIKIEDSVINSDRLKQVINSIFQQRFESYTRPIWQKVKDLDESMSFSTHGVSSEKLIRLQESFLRSQSEKLHEEQLANRIKTIEKTIREMGEDIHLVNDKEEGLCSKIQNELPWLRNELKVMKGWEKKWGEIQGKNSQLKESMEMLMKRMKLIESSMQSNVMNRIKQLQQRVQNMGINIDNSTRKANIEQPAQIIKQSFDKYPSEPIILKYIQKFQITQTKPIQQQPKQQKYEQVTINEMTYYIDQDGYLLDTDSYYLISTIKGDRVRLSPAHLQLLKNKNILI